MKCIALKTPSQSYDALLDRGLLSRAGGLLQRRVNVRRELIVVISSPTVWNHWGASLSASLDKARLRWQKLLIEDGECAKTLSAVEHAAEQLIALGADRSSVVVAFGGGVIGDIAGFVAAIFMRGVRLVQIPTTLLAQVDASIGGKTGVNLAIGKNLIGSFHHPAVALIDPSVLATLSDREFRAGLFEVMKSGIIADASLFDTIEERRTAILARDPALIAFCIDSSVRVKAGIVSKDERESGLRRVLNFGHTIGHALESETHYKRFLHGEAVGWGMLAAALVGVGQRRTSADAARRIAAAVLAYGPLPSVECAGPALLRRIGSDKKSVAGKNVFVLATDIGSTTIAHDVPEDVILRAIEQLRQLSA